MNRLMVVSIITIMTIGIINVVECIRYYKSKRMIELSIQNCIKAIKEKEGK